MKIKLIVVGFSGDLGLMLSLVLIKKNSELANLQKYFAKSVQNYLLFYFACFLLFMILKFIYRRFFYLY